MIVCDSYFMCNDKKCSKAHYIKRNEMCFKLTCTDPECLYSHEYAKETNFIIKRPPKFFNCPFGKTCTNIDCSYIHESSNINNEYCEPTPSCLSEIVNAIKNYVGSKKAELIKNWKTTSI